MTEPLKSIWIFEVEGTNHWGRTPDTAPEDFEGYEFLEDGAAISREDAERAVYEYECAYADSCGEPEFHECADCDAEGCDECDGTGGSQQDYSEFVGEHAQTKLVQYDPNKHMAVKSTRTEHLKYAHEKAIADLEYQIERDMNDLGLMQDKLTKLGNDIANRRRKMIDRKLLLAKLENQ